ncbi:MAG: right-handed parallel beta-helix repeat-containing protein [Candidatus Heimdallarchaeota archaeon]|nr:right-handed parallel beta-helix repeat-containing protein [Candidatus Heimdallarchaeota archaeon]
MSLRDKFPKMSTKGIVILIAVIIVGGAFIGIFAWIRANREYNYGYIVITKDKDFTKRYNFPGAGTEEDPYRIENLTIEVQSVYGILISDTSSHFIIRNCTVSGNAGIYIRNIKANTAIITQNTITVLPESYGIGLESAPGTVISQNNLIGEANKSMIGINVFSSKNCLIELNTLTLLSHAIEVWGVSDNINVYDNICLNSSIGIFIDARDWYSYPGGFHQGSIENIQLMNNTCLNNNFGIFLLGAVSLANLEINDCSYNKIAGIEIGGCSEIYVNANFFYNNTQALILYDASKITVSQNLFRNGASYAINATLTSDSVFYHNNFYNNNLNGQTSNQSQAYDDSLVASNDARNYWYNAIISEGNYWDDWGGVGTYPIDGGDHVDQFPLGTPH